MRPGRAEARRGGFDIGRINENAGRGPLQRHHPPSTAPGPTKHPSCLAFLPAGPGTATRPPKSVPCVVQGVLRWVLAREGPGRRAWMNSPSCPAARVPPLTSWRAAPQLQPGRRRPHLGEPRPGQHICNRRAGIVGTVVVDQLKQPGEGLLVCRDRAGPRAHRMNARARPGRAWQPMSWKTATSSALMNSPRTHQGEAFVIQGGHP
jgi:hypothetical protein